MVNRREFVQGSVSAAALGTALWSTGSLAKAAVALEPALALYRIVYDERFTAGRHFGEQARRFGTAVTAIRGDITALWNDDLYSRWKRGPAAIAGLTTDSSLFMLDLMARDAGMRVVYRADHRFAEGRINHETSGPENMLEQMARLPQAGWSAALPSIILSCPATGLTPTAARLGPALTSTANQDESLVSWVIAPIARG